MPPRTFTLGLLWFATAALLALLGLLIGLRGPGAGAVDAALVLNLLLLPLPPLGLYALRRRAAPPGREEVQAGFLTQISHQVRTPLNTVMGMTQLALQTPLSLEQRELLTRADAASRSLLGVVNDLLDVARIESGRLEIAALPLRLEDVVAHAIELVRPQHSNPAVVLVCDWADAGLLGARGQLRGDAPRLQQVLARLLAHALEFAPAGPVALRLDIGPGAGDGRVPLLITVQQGEAGREAGHHPRQDAAQPGLAVTRRLLELMGGDLHVLNGSRFEVRLALPQDAAASPAPPLRPCRLLLAEGQAAARASTQQLLRHLGLGEGLGASADVAATLATLDEARHQGRPFDWLLLDWRLPGPGPGGAELLARLRRDHPALRIAVLAAPGLDDGLAQARAFGARALLQRPLLPTDLRHLLQDDAGERLVDPEAQALSGLRVLLIEDHPVNQEIALRLLGSRGARVDVAGDGQQGLDKLQAGGPGAYDLVLMDLQMPVLDGLGATRRLRQWPGFETLPVLAMTAHALAEERAECLAAGMQGHIAKPLDVGRLVRELQRYRPPPPVPAAAPVLDMALALRQFDGQAALYRRTLQGFVDQYDGGIAHWLPWLEAGEWGELRRAAHTLQGLAATVGARPLHHDALALERSAALADDHAAGMQFGRVAAALARLLDEIRTTLARPAAAAAAPAQDGADLGELQSLLGQNDSRALDWWQAHGAASGLDDDTRQRLEQALAALDFDAAALAIGGRVR